MYGIICLKDKAKDKLLGDFVFMNFKNKKEQMNDRRKKQIVKNWLSSFLTTSIVVTSVLFIVPTAPTAEYLSLEAIGRDVYYEIQIEDVENALLENTLFIEAKSPLDTQRQELEHGQGYGWFYGLNANTKYKISVVGSIGYGEFNLVTQEVLVKEDYGAEILRAEYFEEYLYSQTLGCSVDVAYSDYKNEISFIYLNYAFIPIDQVDNPIFWDNLEYTQEEVVSTYYNTTIFNIPKVEGYLHFMIEAIFIDNRVEVLQEKQVYVPTIVNAYIYIENVTDSTVELFVYPDESILDANYSVTLIQNEVIVEQKEVVFVEIEPGYHEGMLAFENLQLGQEYEVEFYITFYDSQLNEQTTRLIQNLYVYMGQPYHPYA